MTRIEKKCMAFSLGLHSLLAIILIGSAAFRSAPEKSDMTILTMIPSRILDQPGVGGGNPNIQQQPPVAQPQPQPQPPAPQPVAQPPQPQPDRAPPKPEPKPEPREVSTPKPKAAEVVKRPEPKPVERVVPETTSRSLLPSPKPAPPKHQIEVDYTPYNPSKTRKTVKPKDNDTSDADAQEQRRAAAQRRADAKRRAAIDQAFNTFASDAAPRIASRTVIDQPGDGGESFADYRTVIFNVYFHAWTPPESVANRNAETKAKVVIARDGSVISADIVSGSHDSGVDKSVERALRKVRELPPFPEGAKDSQRTFYIIFSPRAKDEAG